MERQNVLWKLYGQIKWKYTRYMHAQDVPHAEHVESWHVDMWSYGEALCSRSEDVSGVTQPSPNAKLCGVVRGVSPMKKSKTCVYFDGEISDGKSTMQLLVLAHKSSFTFFLPSFISLLSTQSSFVPLHPLSGLPSSSSVRRVFHHEHKRTKEGHVLEDT